MKILYIDNQPTSRQIELSDEYQTFLISALSKKAEIKCVGKPDWKYFYSIYLKFKPDLIITEWIPASLIPLLLKKIGLIKCPITLNWGDYYSEMMEDTLKHPKFLTRFMEEYTARNADFITTVSRKNEAKARKIGKPVYYIPHGVFESNIKTKIKLSELKTKKENLIVLYLGEQSKWKRVDKIIEASKELPCDLFLFGKTNLDFQKMASSNVHFMGYIDKMEVNSILQQTDILVITGDQDCSYKLFEYIKAGKVILAYDGLINNVLSNRENALLVKDFKEGLKELIQNKKLRDKLIKNVKKLPVYSWEQVADKYIKIYKEILSKKKK
jgi:glycosyltransferase involved in cell wall biosynthesis